MIFYQQHIIDLAVYASDNINEFMEQVKKDEIVIYEKYFENTVISES